MSFEWLSWKRDHSWLLKTVKSSSSKVSRFFSTVALSSVNFFSSFTVSSMAVFISGV